uniref:Uncharacterized protein n=1 Tax=Panagrolaimus sp. PS1159 TaxID=55785 RepID=A0AC35FLX6_9BILA
MFYRFKYLWIFIAFLILSEAFDEDRVCDEDCLISKSDFLSKKRIHRSNPSQTCSFQGIDTSASDGPFQLFGKNNSSYDINSLTGQNGICDCSVVENKHAVVKKEMNGKIILTDVYVGCGKVNANESVLEELIFDYIKNVPERTLGKEPQLKKDDDENCLDEHGFITPKLPGDVPCYSYVSAFTNGTYSSTNQLLEGNVTYYSGPFSVNRIDQFENLTHPNFGDKYASMLAIFYELKQTCDITELNLEEDNHCHSFFNNATYSIICCCNVKPGQCSFRRYKEKSLVCAEGSYSMTIGSEPVSSAKNRTLIKNLKNDLVQKNFCSSEYVFNATTIKYKMPAPLFNECNASDGDKGYCVLNNDVCPSDEQNPSETIITCCCRKPDLCNVDFVAINAVNRFKFMIENKVCDQPMLYSILFARTNYTLEGDDKQPLCYIHYDEQNPDARYFLPNNNLDLLRDVDYQAYRKEGCNVIAAKIRLISKNKCPKENYSEDDTKLPRPLFLCTCNGTKIETETPHG